MSETQQAPGYWQASDGQWYPPDRHPDFRPPGPGSGLAPTSVVPNIPPPPGPGASPSPQMPPSVQQTVPTSQMTRMQVQGAVQSGLYRPPSYNELHTVHYKGGWIGMFGGENQEKALRRAIPLINASGQRVVAAVEDRWSFWKKLGAFLLVIITIGFVGRKPNVLLITEPMG